MFQCIDNGKVEAVTSELTLAEVLVKPMEKELTVQQAIYIQVITQTEHLKLSPVSLDILIGSAKIRGVAKGKLPDAILNNITHYKKSISFAARKIIYFLSCNRINTCYMRKRYF